MDGIQPSTTRDLHARLRIAAAPIAVDVGRAAAPGDSSIRTAGENEGGGEHVNRWNESYGSQPTGPHPPELHRRG